MTSKQHNYAFDQAGKLHAQGKVRKALKILEQLLKQGEDDERTLTALVKIHVERSETNKAIKYLKKLCKVDARSLLYCDTLAKMYQESNQPQAAMECYKNFLSKNPSEANAYYSLAQIQQKHQQMHDATLSYEAALEQNISEPEEVHVNLSVIYSDLAQSDEAIAQLHLAIEKNANYVPALFNLGSRYEEKGNLEQAQAQFSRVLDIDTDHALALARLAALKRYEKNDPIIPKLVAATESPELPPLSRVDLHFALGKVLDDCHEYEKAFASYEAANRLQSTLGSQYQELEQERFVTGLIEFFDAQWFAKLDPVSTASPIFICGMFRSGSTLAEQVLAAHTEVTAGGECSYMPNLVSRELAPFPKKLERTKQKMRADFAQGYLDYLQARYQTTQTVTDKRPENFLYIGLIKTLFPNAILIHTDRNALDNCLSVYFTQLIEQMSYATDLASIAHYYEQQQRLMSHWATLFPNDIYELNYEALLADPEFQIRKLLKFCKLEWQQNCLDFHLNDNNVQTASAWQVRQPLYLTSRGRWHNYRANINVLLDKFPDGHI